MPIFMDIHYATQATAKDIAELHQLDLDRQDDYKCKMLTYWFDDKRGFVFCLAECENKEALLTLHRHTHYQEPHKIIEVNANMVNLFLGRLSDPERSNPESELEHFINETAFRTILRLELRFIKKERDSNITKAFNKIVEDSLKDFEGKEVDNKSGEITASFFSSANAAKCALKIQNTFKKNTDPKNNSEIAIGLSIGSPVDEHDDFFGDTLLSTKRLCDIARSGKIIFSSAFRDVYEDNLTESEKRFVKILNPTEEEFLNSLMNTTEQIWNDENYNVDNFSKKIGLSKSQLYRKVKLLTGFSPNEFIKEYRLKKALKFLRERKGNISEVAFEIGFNNASYFSKCFQKKYGVNPSDFYRMPA